MKLSEPGCQKLVTQNRRSMQTCILTYSKLKERTFVDMNSRQKGPSIFPSAVPHCLGTGRGNMSLER